MSCTGCGGRLLSRITEMKAFHSTARCICSDRVVFLLLTLSVLSWYDDMPWQCTCNSCIVHGLQIEVQPALAQGTPRGRAAREALAEISRAQLPPQLQPPLPASARVQTWVQNAAHGDSGSESGAETPPVCSVFVFVTICQVHSCRRLVSPPAIYNLLIHLVTCRAAISVCVDQTGPSFFNLYCPFPLYSTLQQSSGGCNPLMYCITHLCSCCTSLVLLASSQHCHL